MSDLPPPDPLDGAFPADEPAPAAFDMRSEKLRELARLDLVAYYQGRAGAAKEIGVPPAALDKLVARLRKDDAPRVRAEGDKAADLLLEIVVQAGIEMWPDEDGEAYATIPVYGHREHHPLRSRAFKAWALRLYARAARRALQDGTEVPGSVSPDTLAAALLTLEAMAMDAPARRPAVRSAWGPDNCIYIDLGTPDWTVAKVTARGWSVQARCPVPFIRPPGLRALPAPVKKGAIGDLRELVNLPGEGGDDARFMLFVSAMVGALWPSGPYPVLVVLGEAGGGKTTLCTLFRRLTDPNRAELRSPPKDEADLLHAAVNGRVVAIENVSRLSPEMSDMLCRISTGAGFGKRRLYTDGEEYLIEVCNPVVINGVDVGPLRGDMVSRAVILSLPPLAAHDQASRIESDFTAVAGSVFGALLSGLAAALRNRKAIQSKGYPLPRMADFAVTAMAAAEAFGWSPENVLTALNANRAAAVEEVIEADHVGSLLRRLAEGSDPETREENQARARRGDPVWTGTAAELLDRLNTMAPEVWRRARGWPADATRLSARITRVEPELRKIGVVVERRRGSARDRTRTLSLFFRLTASAASGASDNEE
ncbi:hypothetical protein [Elioraea sp.]|uniref:hypothetical protein n=1 Tax=Elioraea sp. TaxID=2185103 RepID=UPI003F6F2EFA